MSETFVDITADDTAAAPPTTRARRWLTGPPRWLFATLAGLTALLTLAVYAVPGGYFLGWLVVIAAWLTLALAWLARVGLSVALGDGWPGVIRRWTAWAVLPALVLVTGGLVVAQAPLRAGLLLAEPAMRAYVADATAAPPTRVGPYPLETVDRIPGGARFLVKGSGLLDPGGFVYSPDGPPPRIGEDTYRHLQGPWYVWVESW